MDDLVIRPWQYGDRHELAALADNRKIWDNVRDYFPSPYTLRHAKEWIEAHSGKDPAESFAIVHKGRLAGAIGVFKKSDVYRCTAELGYWIGEPYWGKGVATEAVRRVTVMAFSRDSGLVRIYAEVFAKNTASQRVLEKNGFVLESRRRSAYIKNGRLGDDTVWVLFRGGQSQ